MPANDLLILLRTVFRLLPHSPSAPLDISLHHFNCLQQFMHFHRHGKTDQIAYLSLLNGRRRSDQKHLKLRWQIIVNFHIHHIHKPASADQYSTLQIVYACQCRAPVVQTACTEYPLCVNIFFMPAATSGFEKAITMLLTIRSPVKSYTDTLRSPSRLPVYGTASILPLLPRSVCC